jgi:hypothetical protein
MFILTKTIIAYIKNEGSNLHTCANALNFVVSCSNLRLLEPFDGSLFWPCTLKGVPIYYYI